MYKSFQYYTPYISLFTSYPRLQSMAPPVAPPAFFTKLTPAQFETIASVGKIVRATKYDDKNDQRVFLDEKVVILDGFSAFLAHIATEQTLYDTFYSVKNSYHQSATHSGGVIGGRYPLILDLCARLKAERERAKNAVVLAQQQHRQELEDIRALKEQKDAEAKAAKEAARLSKKDKQWAKTKRVKSKPTVEDADDEGSVFDDADYPLELAEGSGEADDPMIVDDQVTSVDELRAQLYELKIVPSVSDTVGHRSTQSLDERPLVSETLVEDINPELASQLIIQSRIAEFLKLSVPIRYASPSVKFAALTDALSRVVTEEFDSPGGRKRQRRSHSLAFDDSEDQFAAAELATNNDRAKQTVAAANAALASSAHQATIGSLRLEESELRSRIAFSNSQLRYQLDHREYLLRDLKRVLDAQHRRSPPSGSSARG
ncbi:hypothetical protein C8R44DRAFT_887782 [Mycena epipterygia]|nr:hypothetical protein C8R44DRAFT_887782 [Mycena epipterygia]